MKLSQIYERDIERTIDSAVTVSNRNTDTIDTEIKEYVFTKELKEKLYSFLENVLLRKSNRTGIWINGYYGSGKSHFIKYIDYCLSSENSNKAFEHFIEAAKDDPGDFSEATASNIANLKNHIGKNKVETITFNVEDETDDGSGDRLTRIFINMLNRHRGYNSDNIPLAILLEKELDKKGVFEAFQKVLKDEHGLIWKGNEQNYAGFALETVLEAAKKVAPGIDTTSLHSRINNAETYKVGIKTTLIPELKDYIKDTDKNFRLLFLVDEISQYIGKNKEVLLNFQNIIERVSEDLDNKVWIACTAQQTLDDVAQGVGSNDVKDEFGKILGRFPADFRVSLESSDPAYITQKRILDKNADGRIAVESLYRSNEDAINNQFKMHHDLYKGYATEHDFLLSYPFVPYQFQLIADVFDAFQSLQFVIKEVKNNERSVLGITHFTAKKLAEKEVGFIVPFDAFYNDQFNTNLTHRGRKAISAGMELSYVKKNEFAERVLKTLFMISNLSESVRQTFPSTVDNMTLLLMTSIDENKLQLQKNTQEVLIKLMDESIIREENGSYFFFNEDEIDVKIQIQNTHLNYEDRLDMFDSLLRPLMAVNRKVHFGQSDFQVCYKVEDKEALRNGDVTVKLLLMENSRAEEKMFGNPNHTLLFLINEWFRNNDELQKDFELYTKTEKYLRNNGDTVQGTREKTLNNFRSRNATLKAKLVERFTHRFSETRFVSGQQIIDPSEINGSKPAERYANVLNRHLNNVYKYNRLAEDYLSNANDLKKAIPNLKSQQRIDNTLSSAENRVNDHITTNGNIMPVSDLIREFTKAPYGWRDIQVINILVMLNIKKVREFEYRGQARYPLEQFVAKSLVTSEREVLFVKQGEAIPAETIESARNAYREIFNTEPSAKTDGNELYETLHKNIGQIKQNTLEQAESYLQYPFRKVFHTYQLQLEELFDIRDPKRFFETLIDKCNELKELSDQCKQLEGFLGRALPEYDKIKKFIELNADNLASLDAENNDKIEWLTNFFNREDPSADFRTARKTFSELNGDINQLLKSLQEEALKTYNEVYDSLVAEANKKEVPLSSFATRSHKMESLKRLKSISSLRLAIKDAGDFKSQQLDAIIKEANRQQGNDKAEEPPVHYKPGGNNKFSIISNQQELNEYLTEVRSEMEKILNENKKIILE